MILTLILGPLMEQSLRQSLEISRGSFAIFFTQPIALFLILVALAFAVLATRSALVAVRGAEFRSLTAAAKGNPCASA